MQQAIRNITACKIFVDCVPEETRAGGGNYENGIEAFESVISDWRLRFKIIATRRFSTFKRCSKYFFFILCSNFFEAATQYPGGIRSHDHRFIRFFS
jgi:hypothetical protein